MLVRLARIASAIVLALLVSLGSLQPAVAQAGDLLPNLVTMTPRNLFIEVVNGEKRLHFTNEIANKGSGPLELAPVTSDPNPCGTGNVPVVQRIFQDANADGIFTRSVDTSFQKVSAGCYVFHPTHSHWHFDNLAKYQLVSQSGAIVVQGFKQSVCVEDSAPAFSLPGSPSTSYYQDCAQVSVEGISVGWGDIYYGSTTPEQYLVITGVPDGNYCLASTADPDNTLVETADTDNGASIGLNLSGGTVTPVSNLACSASSTGPRAAYYVYDDSLHWDNWSWRTTLNPNVTSPVFSGARSLGVTFNSAWAGMSFHNSGFDTTPFTHLHFAIHPGGQPLFQ